MRLLALNVGGASAKLVAYDLRAPEPRRLGDSELHRDAAMPVAAFAAAVAEAAAMLARRLSISAWDAAAHRIVHGGTRCREPAYLDDAVRDAIRTATPLAPLHNPAALAVADAIATAAPELPQVAVFDTGFFAQLPDVARGYALSPAVAGSLELVRCGFHGLAHAAMSELADAALAGRPVRRVVTLQLGSGSSVAAIRDGCAIDVSMGYSTLEGLVMGTRCGDVDAGAVLQLLQQPGADIQRLARQLAQESGLLGLSGRSADVRELLAAEASDAACRRALDHYVYRARRYVGSYLAALGGIDAILFGGGVGEHAPVIRARIVEGLGFAGIALDAARNAAARGGTQAIGAAGSIPVLAVAVDEGRQLARAAHSLLRNRNPPHDDPADETPR